MVGFSLVVLLSPKSPSGGEVAGIDKVIHALLFAALAAATAARFRRGLGWVLVYAVVSEILQAVLPIHRDGDVWDAVADSVGALLGWGAALAATRHRDRAAGP
jgi:VanZ family protein